MSESFLKREAPHPRTPCRNLTLLLQLAAVDWNYDVFIVHTGPLKQLASDLNEELRRLGFTIFMLDSEGGYADARMLLSVGMSPIGLALINADFLEWRWPLRELESLVKAGSLLPVLIGMSITEFEQAWRASSAAAGLGEEMFESVMRTTFVVDQGGWRDQLRERICIAMLRRIVEEVCPRLPDGAASMRIVERALKAARLVAAHHFVDLRGRDIQAAAAWVTYLEDFREAGTARFRTGFDLLALEPQEVNVPIGMPESPVSQAARILVRCTMPGADGVADLSHLPDLPGLALDRWLEPKEMGALRSQLCAGLRSLKVDGIVAIAKLPNLVASFTHLSSISLLGTRLRKFPPELCQLTSLQSLAMGRQGPEVIPEMQGSLERLGAFQLLTELRLRDMGLTELSWSTSSDSSVAPPWPELRILQVDDNKLTELPSWLPLLTLLEELDVSGNELTRLPDFDPVRSRRTELVRISIELQRLGLHSDAGRLLETRGLQSLVPLRSLYVQRNLLTVLPLSLVDIRDTLTTLVANPQKDPSKPGERGGLRSLRLPPEEVLAKPIGTVLRFLEEMRDTGQQTRTMMKVSFVGEGGAGKTHLCLALQGKLDQYGYDDPETVGIETGAWVAKSEDKTKAPVFCRSWDFAGEFGKA